MKQFSIKIEMGNEAMQDAEDVAIVLGRVAKDLQAGKTEGPIHDLNGNRVGEFKLR